MLQWGNGNIPVGEVLDEAIISVTAEIGEKEQIQSFAVAPFSVKSELYGLIAVGSRARRKFSPGDTDLLTAFGNQIGVCTHNAMLFEEVRALIRETFDAQEAERERICLEVHDGMAQTLASAFHYLQALEATPPEDKNSKQLLVRAIALVKQTI